MLVPSVSLVSCRQPSELQINPAGTESRAGAGNQQLYELSPAPWVRGCSTPEIGLGLSRVPPWSEWGPPSQVGSPPLLRQPPLLQVPPLQLVCSVPSAEPGQPPHCCFLGFGVVTGKMPPLSQSTRWQRFCVLQGLVKPPALWSQVGHPEPAYASKSSF